MPSDRTPRRELPDSLAFALLEAREARGWSQREAARRTGVSRRMIQHLEHGDRVPSRAVADALATAYRLDAIDPSAARQLLRLAVTDAGRSGPYYRPTTPTPTPTTPAPATAAPTASAASRRGVEP